ncbi:MAG TPA: hypothetical protein VF401_02495 [Candidatus Saccharimonadales bacterium]
MKRMTKDLLTASIGIFGAIVMYAKLNSYSWWLIGSWKGALGVLAVLGLVVLALNGRELLRAKDTQSLLVIAGWILAATVVIGSIFVTTTKLEFIWAGVFLGLGVAEVLTRDAWIRHGSDSQTHHYISA